MRQWGNDTNQKEATGSSLDIITFAIWAFPALQVEQSPMEPPQQHKNSESSRKTAPNTCHSPTQQRLGSKALILRFLQYHVSYFYVHSQDSKTVRSILYGASLKVRCWESILVMPTHCLQRPYCTKHPPPVVRRNPQRWCLSALIGRGVLQYMKIMSPAVKLQTSRALLLSYLYPYMVLGKF